MDSLDSLGIFGRLVVQHVFSTSDIMTSLCSNYNPSQEPVEGFHLSDHLDYMASLNTQYGHLLLGDLENLQTC